MLITAKMFVLISFSMLIVSGCWQQNSKADSLSEYFNNHSPGAVTEIFAPNLISKGFHELGIAVSKNSNEIFYIMSDCGYKHYALINIIKINNKWSAPQRAEFANNMSVYTCFFSPDNSGLYFSTNRPVVYKSDTLKGSNNWFTARKGDGWDEPELINEYFDTSKNDRIQSISTSKNLYITRAVPDKKNNIFVSRFADGGFQAPEPLKGLVNSEFGEGRPFIAPDESYLIFQSDRPGGFGNNDLWISFPEGNEYWGIPLNLGKQINSESSDFGPFISPNGKYLFFSSYRTFRQSELINKSYEDLIEMYNSPLNGYAALHWADAKIIEDLQEQQLNK